MGPIPCIRCAVAWLPALTLLVAATWQTVVVADEVERETLIKAAIVYKLAKFVEWPDASFAGPDSPLRLCLLGDTQLATALRAAEGRAVRGHPVAVGQLEDPSGVDDCHVVYVARDQQAQLGRLLTRFNGHPVLSVSEIDDFAHHGGVIGLVRRGKRLGFQVNLRNAQRAGLTVSAPLLELAEVIGRDS